MAWKLFQYKDAFSETYDRCSDRLKLAVDRRMAQLLERGNLAKFPVTEPLEDGIFQLRGDTAGEHARFLYFFQPGQRIIVVLGSLKNQRKLPKRMLKRAKGIRDTLLSSPELMDDITQIH